MKLEQFASRLRSFWIHYCETRKANDFESLVNLIVSDKLFQTLDNELSSHTAVRQEESWLRQEELAKECDIYFTAKDRYFNEIKNDKSTIGCDPVNQNFKYVPQPLTINDQIANEQKYSSKPWESYICSSRSHLAKNCPNKRNKFNRLCKENDDVQVKPKGKPQTSNVSNANENVVVPNANFKCPQNGKTY